MSRTVVVYLVAGAALAVWLGTTGDLLPLGLLFVLVVVGLLHLSGPRGIGTSAEDHQIREQSKARYGVNAPDHGPRF
jgi:hypothetical protein